jgi:hypothetical protein
MEKERGRGREEREESSLTTLECCIASLNICHDMSWWQKLKAAILD